MKDKIKKEILEKRKKLSKDKVLKKSAKVIEKLKKTKE
jgi:hypothetical protein